MKRLALLALTALAAAACTSQPATYRDLETMANRQQREAISRPPPDSCQMAAHQDLIGKHRDEIDESALPTGARVVCSGCAVTLDFRAERLNVQLGPDNRVASLRCG